MDGKMRRDGWIEQIDRWMDEWIDRLIDRNSSVCMPEKVIVYDDQIISDSLYVPPASF